ncbi:deoxyribonuclease [Ignicoccus pacificus DSM 13166]|uniref:Deoxyribonuclease n=1 Tax=Ignicoccus pacificus DSM 13166 TaxID=940294 RepID=A0A977K974_9CREN|nr:deoxyribonuclease [Ignicoccus pacificus DSM 13166]
MSYVDAHVHLHEDPSLIEKDFLIVAVSDDLESSIKTLKLEGVFKCVGIHPWEVEESRESDLKKIEELAESAHCLGEVGLDYRFVKNRERERKFFEFFLNLSREYDLPMNLHALDAWREVFDLLLKYDIKRAYFHWYNGPLDLIEEITSQGYYIGINAAIKIQKKHLRVLERAPLKAILTESDGPYKYRGITLKPSMVREEIQKIAEVKGISAERVKEVVLSNLRSWLNLSLL